MTGDGADRSGGPAATLAALAGIDPDAIPPEADRSFPLDSEQRVHLVLSGNLDIFLLVDGGTPASSGANGVRHHLARIPEGDLVLALSCPDADCRYLAVPTPGTRLAETTLDSLLGARGSGLAVLAAAIDRWLSRITASGALSRPPRNARGIGASADGPARVAAGDALSGMDSPIWVEGVPPEASFCGAATIGEAEKGRCFPLVGDAWLQLDTEVELRPLTTSQWLERTVSFRDLARYGRLIAALFAAQVQRRREGIAGRIETRRRFAEGVFDQALQRLFDVLGRPGRKIAASSAHPLLSAMQQVAQAQGMDLPVDDELTTMADREADPVSAVARHAGFFVRKVVLEGEWWRADHGPLLAFIDQTHAPCALIPVSAGRYQWLDPTTGTRQRVTGEDAKRFERTAFAFFRPFPETVALNGWQLARFGAEGGARDVMLIAWMLLLTGALSLVTPLFAGWIMDPVIPDARLGQLGLLAAGVILAGLASAGFSFVQAIAMVRLEGRMVYAVQSAVWDRLLKLPAAFFGRYTIGDLANRAGGIDRMRSLVTSSTVTILGHATVGAFSLALMFYYQWGLALITTLLACLYGAIAYSIGRKVLLKNRETMRLTGLIEGLVFQLLGAIGKLRVAAAEQQAYGRWANQYASLQSVIFKQQRLEYVLAVFTTLFHYLALAALLTAVGWKTNQLLAFFETPQSWTAITAQRAQQAFPAGQFFAFFIAFGQFLSALFGITQTLVQLTDLKPLMERVRPILEQPPESRGGASPPGEVRGAIELRGVSFRYSADGPMVLEDVSLHAEPGELIALVGPSGAGKSTIVRLLLGFDTPTSGSIFIDGTPLNGLDQRAVRRHFGVVLQFGRILSGSIYSNITAGVEMSLDDVWEAARLAGLDRDIRAMPMGMETFIGEGAATLSGGQRQRLMIARAVARRPEILIFDEATSALDNETQAMVSGRIAALRCTRIVVAHRLSTIIGADRIHVLDKGKVVESGSYRELTEHDGLFSQLARRQRL